MTPVHRLRLSYLTHKTGPVWHCRLPGSLVREARYYAYRVEGPRDPASGHRFDPDKVLLDPYAPAVYFPPGFSREAASRPGPNDGRAPLGLIDGRRRAFDWRDDRRPRHTHDTVIYELHVRGFTRRPNSVVSPEKRGTFAGLVEKIPYLQDLGVTAVELMPVQQGDPQEGSWWGYMPLSLFAPEQRYASTHDLAAQADEFREMVHAFHQAGIEVLLDVVYNHTTEYDETGPTYSYRGIDNASYYLLREDRSRYRNDAGTGNVLKAANGHVRKLILDSMHYWVHGMHVDGFRFDLASLLTRDPQGRVNLEDPPIFAEISGHPDLSGVRLIAEAWDTSSYQLGRSFPGTTWLQWNGQFRDDVRAFLRGDRGRVGALMARLYGSDDLFPDDLPHAYHAYQSVNYVTSHDGLSLYDLLAYSQGRSGAEGADRPDPLSWNCGWEGDQGVPQEVMDLRRRQARNFCCLLLLANGTPMLRAGDEFLNTQQGHDNPYDQDNETTWLDWDRLEEHRDVFRFFQRMIAFRKAHPSLGRSRFWRDDVRWYGVGPHVDLADHSHSLAFCLHGASQNDQDIYVMVNAYWEGLDFQVQEGRAEEWRRAIDTSLPSPQDIVEAGEEVPLHSLAYRVNARSVVVLARG